MFKLSIVVPVYFNAQNLDPLYGDIKEKIIDVIDYDYEIVFVDDGSGDDSWAVIEQLRQKYDNIRAFRLSRNFGSHAAILCGRANSTGDCAVIKAADLQEPTGMILDMVDSWRAGNNVVLAVRDGRADGSLFTSLYYWLTRKVALPNMPKDGFDIALLDRKVIEVLDRMDEKNSALTGQILWSGFKTGTVHYTRQERAIGKSRWTLRKKLRLVTDTLFSFSTLPITLVSLVGALSFAGALVWGVVVLIFRLAGAIAVQGWTTLFIFNLFAFGVVMLTLGILGGYLWRAFDASRGRPLYIVEKELGAPDDAQKEPRR